MKTAFVLSAGDSPDPKRAGGKASALMKLSHTFNVPEFFVITPVAFEGTTLRQAAKIDIETALKQLGGGPFAVRSSAVDEDGAGASFAGQMKSFLDVPPEEVTSRAEDVAASGQAKNVADYRKTQGLAQKSETAVLVQRMINAEIAGVAFSADPVRVRRDRIIVNAVQGLGDRLVGGEVSGETYKLNRQGCVIERPENSLLDNDTLVRIGVLAKALENEQGVPQDVEWAIADKTLYLLQARPITTLPDIAGFNLFDNSNIVESYSGVTSPLTLSFAQYIYREVYQAFLALMGVPSKRIKSSDVVFGNLLTSIEGHVYYDLLNWYRMLALFPGFRLNTRYMEQMMGVAEELPPDVLKLVLPPQPQGLERILAWAEIGHVALGLGVHAVMFPRTREAFYKRLNAVLGGDTPRSLETLSLQELAGRYRALERQLLRQWDAPLINDFFCMVAFGLSRQILQKFLGPERGAKLHADSLIGQGDIISAEPAQLIRSMAQMIRKNQSWLAEIKDEGLRALSKHPELACAFDAYLAKFGDRCTQELKLESLTLEEDPAPLLASMIALACNPERTAGERPDPFVSMRNELRGKPLQYLVAKFFVGWAKNRVRDRENMRFERTRVFGRVRKIMLAIGQRLSENGTIRAPRNIFFLTVDEALSLAERGASEPGMGEKAASREEQSRQWADKAPLPNRISGYGMADSLVKELGSEVQVSESNDLENRKGLGCCAGVVCAKVRVIRDPRREALETGEIMVAEFTDPGWIAVFTGAAGILVERGSLLSHSAIVARELGIPAIVNLPQATRWLKTGDIVEMNGATGEVKCL